jgi:hypothetical protein
MSHENPLASRVTRTESIPDLPEVEPVVESPKKVGRDAEVELRLAELKAQLAPGSEEAAPTESQIEEELLGLAHETASLRQELALATETLRSRTSKGPGLFRRIFAVGKERASIRASEEIRRKFEADRSGLANTARRMAERLKSLETRWDAAVDALPEERRRRLQDQREALEAPHGELLPESGEPASLDEAREILGRDVLGPEEIEKALGFKPDRVPPLQYSKEDLEKAKGLGEMLVLRLNADAEGQPLTMKRLQELAEPRLATKEKTQTLVSTNGYKDEGFFNRDAVPFPYWQLVAKDVIPESVGEDFFGQTRALRDHLQKNGLLKPSDLNGCSDADLEHLEHLYKVDASVNYRVSIPRIIADLPLNQHHRRSPVEVFYDLLVVYGSRNEILLKDSYEQTNRQNNLGDLVFIGGFGGSMGAFVDGNKTNRGRANLGICPTR